MQNQEKGFNQNPYIQQNNNNGQNSSNGMGQGGMKMNQGRGKQKNSKNNNYDMRNRDSSQNPYYNKSDKNSSLYGSFDTANFLKGALIGAVGAYLLTNEKAQKAIFKTAVKGSEMFQTGMEEMKERFEDAKAEMEAEK